ncbi:protein ITPRID1 [Etheostoma spectabile]|uniref:protein ITPRID1 n=1 Tax=Etheostoma spectabile TaxID=54343 RepID=UPI0013AF48EF|nr:protein ITPRID1 [Etheostoma spectabile]
MASEGAPAKRSKLVASRVHWSPMDLPEDQVSHGNWSRDSVRKWLTTTVTEEDAKREPLREAAEPLRRNASADDDLALGVEASLYGSQGVRTVQEFLRWRRSDPALCRWNSVSTAVSAHSGPLSVMDVLNLWNDDPEEVLLDLGFGCDEPDLSGRIPARFINHQSQAKGINLQVFLEAQKSRLDLENPDVSNRFRQLEVLQQVTTAFSSLMGSSSPSPLTAPLGRALTPEARERRQRIGMLFRRASRNSLSQIHNPKTQDLTTPAATSSPCATLESLQPPISLGEKKVLLKRVKPGLSETVCLSPLAEELGAVPDPQPQPIVAPLIVQEGAVRPWPMTEAHPQTANTFSLKRKARESFEMEEIQSFDETSVTGSYTGGAENLARCVIRTNSCQSDSSGFLEEPFIPSLSQQAAPGPDLIKALSGLSGGSTDSQSSERPGSPSPSPLTPPPSSLTSSGGDRSLISPPSPSAERSLEFSPSLSSDSLCPPKSDLPPSPGTETAPDQDQAPPASPPPLACEYLSPRSPSPGLQNETHSQSPTLPSPAVVTSLSPPSSPMQPGSLIGGSEEIKTEDNDAPCPHLSTLFNDSEGPACANGSRVPHPASSPSPIPNLDCQFSESIATPSKQPDSSGSPENTQSQWTDGTSHGNSLSSSCGVSSRPSSPPGFLCPSYLAPPPLVESVSQSPENRQKDSLFPDSDGKELSDSTITQKKGKETPSTGSLQLDNNNPSALSSLIVDPSEFEKSCPTLPSPKPSISVCQSVMSSLSHDSDAPIDPAVSDLTEQSISQQDRPCSHDSTDDDNTDPVPACPVQAVINVKMNRLSLDLEDTHQRNGKGEVEGGGHTDTVQTQEAVYVTDTDSSAGLSEGSRLVSEEVCNQTEIDPQVRPCSLHDELSTGTQPEDKREMNDSESESLTRSLVVPEDVPEECSRTEAEPKDLIRIESLDEVFQTSVDDSESENGDMDAFFQQLDAEGRVYWAEPIQVSNPSSFETSDGSPGNSLLPSSPAVQDSLPSTGRARASSLSSSTTMDTDQTSRNAPASSDTPSSFTLAPFRSPTATPHSKLSSRSVSVQMSSSPSSHIVHRKDVPFITGSKRTLLPSVFPVDTSTPFRAVQSWTDLQIQRNTLSNKLSYGALHTAPKEVTVSTGASELPPALNFSSSPYSPLLPPDCVPWMERNDSTMSVSVDKGLWPDEEEEEDRNGNEDEETLWEGNQTSTAACCCSCDHQCTQEMYRRQHSLENTPYSLDELEEMMLCVQQFRSVLSNMEEQLSEDQAAVYSVLSDHDREKVQDIEELRRAVKREAGELEMQLNELAHHYDDSLKMKMHRLLDEQSLLCSQLKVLQPETAPTSSGPAPHRTVATQCCLLPGVPPGDVQSGHVSAWSTWNADSLRQTPPGSKCICEGLGCSPTKADKLDMMGFLQRLKESLRHSLNTDSLE